MTAKGNFTAYRELNPLQGSIAQEMQYQDEMGFKRREEQRQIDAIKKNEEEKKRREKDALRERIVKNISPYDTGSRSLNELVGGLIQRAVNEYVPIIETLDNPKSSEKDKLMAQLKADNISKLPENLKLVTDFYTKQDEMYRKGVANGSFFTNPEYEKIFQSGFENYHLDLDEMGNPVIAFVDKNGDGKNDIVDVQTFEQIKTGLPTFNFQKRFDYDALLKDATLKIQPETNQTDNGFVQVKTTGLNNNKAQSYASNLLLGADGSPTEVMMSIAKERGIDITKPENQQKIINDFVSDMSLRTKSGREVTRKDSALDWEKEKRQAAKDAKEEKKTSFEPVETPPIYNEAKVKPAPGYKTVSVINSKPIPLIQGYVNGKKKNYTNAILNSYTIIKNPNGKRQVVAEIVWQDSKSSTLTQDELAMLDNPNTPQGTKDLLLSKQTKGPENKNEIIYLTEKDGYKFAKQNNMSYNQMKDMAKAGPEENIKTETPAERALRIANGG